MKTFATLIVALTLTMSVANAQTATTTSTTTTTTASAPATPASCEIIKILQGGVIEVGKEPISFVLKTKGCEEIKEVSANGLEFTDLAFKPGRVTAKVKATTSSSETVGFKLVDKDGVETESGDSVFILVLGADVIHVKTIADKAAAAAAMTSKKVKILESRVEVVSNTRPTRDEIAVAISPLKAEILARPTNAQVVAFVAPYETRIADLEGKVNALAQATRTLAEGQAALGNTRRGIFRKKLNAEVAERAEQIRDAFAPAPTTVTTNNK